MLTVLLYLSLNFPVNSAFSNNKCHVFALLFLQGSLDALGEM